MKAKVAKQIANCIIICAKKDKTTTDLRNVYEFENNFEFFKSTQTC